MSNIKVKFEGNEVIMPKETKISELPEILGDLFEIFKKCMNKNMQKNITIEEED
jgi:hypothetical protein